MPLQTDERLKAEIQKEGCLWLDYLRIGVIVKKQSWDPYQINAFYELCLYLGYINQRCRVIQPDLILRKLGVRLMGWIRKEALGYSPSANEILIEEWFNPDTNHTHFVMGQPYWWDSLGESMTVQNGSLIGYRVVPLSDFSVPHGRIDA